MIRIKYIYKNPGNYISKKNFNFLLCFFFFFLHLFSTFRATRSTFLTNIFGQLNEEKKKKNVYIFMYYKSNISVESQMNECCIRNTSVIVLRK